MKEVLEWLEEKRGEMLALIELLVNIDSGSYCKEGIDACGAIVARELNADSRK